MSDDPKTDDPLVFPSAVQFADMLSAAITMLAASVDGEATAAKNYVELTLAWDQGIFAKFPFRRVAVTLYRDGGLSPHERAEIACGEALDAKADQERMLKVMADLQTRLRAAEAKASECELDAERYQLLRRVGVIHPVSGAALDRYADVDAVWLDKPDGEVK